MGNGENIMGTYNLGVAINEVGKSKASIKAKGP